MKKEDTEITVDACVLTLTYDEAERLLNQLRELTHGKDREVESETAELIEILDEYVNS